jgi:hypothetical protein
MQIDIKPDDIDRLVKDAIMKSALGEAISKTIRERIEDRSTWSPIASAVGDRLKAIALEVLDQEPFKSQIEAAVRDRIQSFLTGEALAEAVKALASRMINNAER